jgi:hypothetical protein
MLEQAFKKLAIIFWKLICLEFCPWLTRTQSCDAIKKKVDTLRTVTYSGCPMSGGWHDDC